MSLYPIHSHIAHQHLSTSFCMPNSDLYKSSENEHFELLHGGAVSQEMSFGSVAIFYLRSNVSAIIWKFLLHFSPMVYKNKWDVEK